MNELEGKVAVITGASRGLGKKIGQTFARSGAKVVLSSRTKESLEANTSELCAAGLQAAACVCDVSDAHQVERLARFAIKSFGKIDIWINNAGIAGPYGSTLDLSIAQFTSILQTNILGVYYGSVMALRHFLPRNSGKLINILGAGAGNLTPFQNAYGSSKSWIRRFTMVLAKEYRSSAVGIFTLQPGLMNTALLTKIDTFKQHEHRLKNFMPILIRAASKPIEVPARKALWLASAATDGRTGLEVRAGSMIAILFGFVKEGLRRLSRSSVEAVELDINVLPTAFKPLE